MDIIVGIGDVLQIQRKRVNTVQTVQGKGIFSEGPAQVRDDGGIMGKIQVDIIRLLGQGIPSGFSNWQPSRYSFGVFPKKFRKDRAKFLGFA